MGFPIDPLTVMDKIDQLKDQNTRRHWENVQRLVKLETELEKLTGNGQPGMIADILARVSKLERVAYIAFGGLGLIELLHTLRGLGWLGK